MQYVNKERLGIVKKVLSDLRKKVYEIFDSMHWKMRMKRHKFWKTVTRIGIKFLALSILKRSNIYVQHMKKHKKPPFIEKSDEYREQTMYRKIGGKYMNNVLRYNTFMTVSEFTFWGNSEMEVYIDIITRLILDQIQIPFCVPNKMMTAIDHQLYKKYRTNNDDR